MAETVSLLTNGAGSGFGTLTYTPASISPGANKFIEVDVAVYGFDATAGTVTIDGTANNLTYVEIDNTLFSGTSCRQVKFRAMGSSPSAGSPVIHISGTLNDSCQWSFKEWSGTDTSGTHGSGAVVQSAKNTTNGGSPNSLTVTLASGITSGNAVSAAFAVSDDTLQTAGSSYTETSDDNSLSGGDSLSLMTCYHYVGTTTPNASGQPDFADIAGMAIEIKAGSSGVSGTVAAALAAFTSSIAGTPTVNGTAAMTMAVFTSAISGTPKVTGTMAATLGSFASSIAGTPIVNGAITGLMAVFTSAISGTTKILATMAVTLASFISSIAGTSGDAPVAVEPVLPIRLLRRLLIRSPVKRTTEL